MHRPSHAATQGAPFLFLILGLFCSTGTTVSTPKSEELAQTVIFPAPSVAPREMRFSLVLPKDYETSNKSYPVLYLLHGYGGTHLQWVNDGVPGYAKAYDLIVVMPDAGNSFYANWVVRGEGVKDNWEDSIVKDLVGYVDSHYRTIARREGRAIGGLSMGGSGATVIGLRNPDMFCSIASHSGAQMFLVAMMRDRLKVGEPVNPLRERPGWLKDHDIPGFGTFVERSPSGQIVTTLEEVDAIDATKLVLEVPKDKLPDIYIDCGTDDFLFDRFKAFTKILRDNQITHTARIAPGGHSHEYWTTNVRYSMAHQYQVMRAQLAKQGEGISTGRAAK